MFVVLGAQQEGDVLHRLIGEDGERLGIDLQHVLAGELGDGDVLLRAGNHVVLRFVLGEGEGILIEEFRCGHRSLLCMEWEGGGSRRCEQAVHYRHGVYICRY